jgi:hypothetical protein
MGRDSHLGGVLAGLTLTVVFGFAAAGKITSGYWDGIVLYHLFFIYQNDAKFQLLREILNTEQLKAAAILYSRISVLAEASMAIIPWFLPSRWSFAYWILGLLGMLLLTNLNVIEAIGPLLGLSLTALLLTTHQELEELKPQSQNEDGISGGD